MTRPIAFVTLLFAVAAPLPHAAGQDLEAQLKQLQAENTALRQRVKQLEAENARLKAQDQQGSRKVEALQNQLVEQRKETDRLQTQVVELTQTTKALEQEKQTLVVEKQQEQQRSRELYVSRTYDAASDRTSVVSKLSKLRATRGTRADHWVAAEFDHAGQTPARPVEQLTWRVQAIFAGGIYNKAKTVTFIVDGQAAPCGVVDYDKVARRTGSAKNRRRIDDEFFGIVVPRSLVERIGNAKAVTLSIAKSEFSLSTEQIETFRTVAELMRGEH